MDFANFSDGSVLNQFYTESVLFRRMNLISHLRGNAGLFGHQLQLPCFPDCVSEGFLAVDMFPCLHCLHCDGGMHVVRSGNNDGIELASELCQQFPVYSA
jgi:hypothetical protein